MKYYVQYRNVYRSGAVVTEWITFDEAESVAEGQILAQSQENDALGDRAHQIQWQGTTGTVFGGQYRLKLIEERTEA